MLEKIQDWFKGYFTSRRLRDWKENITGYLMIAPSVTLIFIFGIMPVGFALYVSLHKWRIKQSAFRGVDNYLNAIGNITFVVMFIIAIGALVAAYLLFIKIAAKTKETGNRSWFNLLPGFAFTATIITFLRYICFQLPEFLSIADKLIGREKSQALFFQFLRESFNVPIVRAAWIVFILTLTISIFRVPAMFSFISSKYLNTFGC